MATITTDPAATGTPLGVPIGHIDDFGDSDLRMVRVDGRRVCLVRLDGDVFAIDNACPHEGYGLTQGELSDDGLLTCAWHNWKFRITDGECVLGEENVQTHDVTVTDDGSMYVQIRRPDPATVRATVAASLQRAIEKDYVGQMSRDVVRLLRADADPGELIWLAVEAGAPRAEYGWGHAVASATDCLAMVDDIGGDFHDGDWRALPLVQGIAGIAEQTRDRPVRALPAPDASTTRQEFRRQVEAEDVGGAQASVLGAIERGDADVELRSWFTDIVSDHHLSYGHAAIYAQKAFELLDRIGWDRAGTVLPHLVPTILYGIREDKLPYMRPFVKELAAVNLSELTDANVVTDWSDDDTLLDALLGSDRRAPVHAVTRALRDGAGVDGVLDVVVAATSERMLRYDVTSERDFHDDFGWLDMTHGITYANAVRWHHRHNPSPDTVRLAFWSAFLAHWTGRHEWHTTIGPRADIDPLGDDVDSYGRGLQRQALEDHTSSFIVHAHAVKNSVAATREAARTGSPLVLDATARFIAAPRLERFVAANVIRSIDFLSGRIER